MTDKMTDGSNAFLIPAGTVTLLLADVEGSTRLWEADPDAMQDAVVRHDDTIAEVIGQFGGARPIEQGEGDSFVAAFARPSDAVEAALELQRRLDAGPLRIRIGLHTGQVQLRGEGNYIGRTVIRCARLRDIGHGGQILLSDATRAVVQDDLPEKAYLLDLGLHRLKDLLQPEHVFQLCHPELPSDFPMLRSIGTLPHNLPVQLTSFVGRQEELAELRSLVSGNRLLTLTGAGGTGKTRLALQLAAEAVDRFPDGVWVAELAALHQPEDVLPAIARAVGLRDDRLQWASLRHAVVAALVNRRVLLVLDNCEHLIDECATQVEALLRDCPTVNVVATSREALGVAGETAWIVPALTLPPEENPPRISGLGHSDAVQLFVERARAARRDFSLTEENASAVAHICRRLDGVPLAVELAAARASALAPREIADGLDDRFRLLTGASRTAVPRQQTLRASIDWSFDLLDDEERTVFRRLAVFAADFDRDAAAAVVADSDIAPAVALAVLARLVEKSLVVADTSGRGGRYRMLETVRQYARDRLADADETSSVATRHAEHYLAVAEASAKTARSREWGRALDRLAAEYAECREALTWCSTHDLERFGRLVAALGSLWYWRGPRSEGRHWTKLAASSVDAAEQPALALAKVFVVENPFEAVGALHAALPVATEAGDERALARLHSGLGMFVGSMGDLRTANEHLEKGVDYARRVGDPMTEAQSLDFLGQWATVLGDIPGGRRHLDEALKVTTTDGDRLYSLHVLGDVGTRLAWLEGRPAEAVELLTPVVDELRPTNDRLTLARDLEALAGAQVLSGDLEGAATTADELTDVVERMAAPSWAHLPQLARTYIGWATGEVEAFIATFEGRLLPMIDMMGAHAVRYLAMYADASSLAGAHQQAVEAAERAEQIAERTGARGWLAQARFAAARSARALADATAEDRAHAGLSLQVELGAGAFVADGLELLAGMAAGEESWREAARLFGAADTIRAATGWLRRPVLETGYGADVSRTREAIGNEFAAAYAEGAALSQDEAIAYARRGRGERKRPASGWSSLTPTEREVASLAGEGLTNKDIGERLFISPRTVGTHLQHIFQKVGVQSRAALAAEVERRRAAGAF